MSTDRLMQFFGYGHLKPELQETSRQFHEVARWMCDNLPDNPMRSVALHRLIEAKDSAIRARLWTEYPN